MHDAKATGGARNVKWHYPSRTECMVCHSRAANFVIGLETLQMNRDQDYFSIGGGVDNQLHFLESHKLLRVGGAEGSAKMSDQLPTPPAQQPKMPSPYDATASLDSRARAYIHANCAHCHVESGGGNALIEAEYTRPLDQMRLVNVAPLHETLNVKDAKLIAPGDPKHSVLLERMAARLIDKQSGQMPPLATNVRDDAAIKLIWQWIAAMPASPAH